MFQPVVVIPQFSQKQCYVLRAAGAKDDVRPTFGTRLSTPDYPSHIFSISFVFLNSLLFCLISTVLWSGATSICDGIILDINRMIGQISNSNTNTNTQLRYNHITPRENFVDKLGTILSSNGQLYLSSLALNIKPNQLQWHNLNL